MFRRRILTALATIMGLGLAPLSSHDEHSESCRHEWVQGPFYVSAAHGTVGPDYFPYKLTQVEHCIRCGLLRLPWKYRQQMGKNMP